MASLLQAESAYSERYILAYSQTERRKWGMSEDNGSPTSLVATAHSMDSTKVLPLWLENKDGSHRTHVVEKMDTIFSIGKVAS